MPLKLHQIQLLDQKSNNQGFNSINLVKITSSANHTRDRINKDLTAIICKVFIGTILFGPNKYCCSLETAKFYINKLQDSFQREKTQCSVVWIPHSSQLLNEYYRELTNFIWRAQNFCSTDPRCFAKRCLFLFTFFSNIDKSWARYQKQMIGKMLPRVTCVPQKLVQNKPIYWSENERNVVGHTVLERIACLSGLTSR